MKKKRIRDKISVEYLFGAEMKKIVILRIITAMLLLCNMAVIFSFSAQKAQQSQNTSSSVIESAVRLIHSDFNFWSEEKKAEVVQSYQKLVRKIAHMTEYASLGALSCAFVLTFKKVKKGIALSAIFCVLYAASDEIHQLFVPGRSGQISDVLIDTAGSLLGIAAMGLLVLVFVKIKRRKLTRRKDKCRK